MLQSVSELKTINSSYCIYLYIWHSFAFELEVVLPNQFYVQLIMQKISTLDLREELRGSY